VTNNLPKDQLEQLDFNRVAASKSSNHDDEHERSNINQSPQLRSNEKISFARFSEEEMQRFESFFDTYVRVPSTNLDVLETEEGDLPEATSNHNAAPNLVESLNPDDPHVNLEDGEDDFIDFEALLQNGYLDDRDSLNDLFTEILDNEKESISNYESSIFNANIQSIFEENETEEVILDDSIFEKILFVDDNHEDDFDFLDLPPSPELSASINESPFDLPPAPDSMIPAAETIDESSSFNFDLPPVPQPTTSTSVDEVEIEDISALSPVDVANTFFDSGEKISIESDQTSVLQTKKKKKKFTIQIFDTILILIIIVILVLLAVNLSDSLPFNLPFL